VLKPSACGKFSRVSSRKKIAIIPGDGIGKEVIPQAVRVIEATKAPVELTYFDWGADRYLRDGTTVPEGGFEMLSRDFDAILVGAFGDPRVASNIHAKEILLGMRFKMDLYANVRPVRLLDASLCPLKGMEPKDVDFVVIRENTEGPYVDRGSITNRGTADEIAVQEDVNTYKGVRRIIRYAFEYCLQNKKADGSERSRVLLCDKSNAMTIAGSLWQRVFKELSAEYAQIKAEHMYVDALCAQMVRDPRQFDVIVTNNMFGDIISDLAAGLQGGLGMAPSGNIYPGQTSMFEPVHGSAPPIAGKNVANPMGAILTAAMMLRYLGFGYQARWVEGDVLEAVRERKMTADIGGTMGTTEIGDWITKSKFVGYIGDPDFHDGILKTVSREGSQFRVDVEGCSGARFVVTFSDVQSVFSHKPEGMVIEALVEMEAPPHRRFVFRDCYEAENEGGDSVVDVIANDFSVKRL
jgi:3-isopropylmalate dehydrogenase